MSIVVSCPKCARSFALPDDARGDFSTCPDCDEVIDLSLESAFTSRLPTQSPTEIQLKANNARIARLIDNEIDVSSAWNVEQGVGAVLTLLGIRFSSTLSWSVALILFFLPWIDLKCMDKNGEVVTHITFSGAQIITGTSTVVKSKQDPNERNEQPQKLEDRLPNEQAAAWLMMAYALGLTAVVVCKIVYVTRRPSATRAVFGVIAAAVLLALLTSGAWLFLSDPLFPPRDMAAVMEYTKWYYGSYVVNLWAMLSFVVEWWVVRKARRQNSRRVGPA